MINKRLFGADIPTAVKKKLEARQLLAVEARPNEAINSNYKDDRANRYKFEELISNDFNMQADLASRTPFVRMWVGLEVKEKEIAQDVYEEYKVSKKVDASSLREVGGGEAAQHVLEYNRQENKARAYAEGKPGLDVYFDKEKNAHIVKGKWVKDVEKSYGKRIYVLGNHVLDTLDDTTANESVGQQYEGENELLMGVTSDDVFPNEHRDNTYLKPGAGITAFASETEGSIGIIRKSTINFTVHNFRDYEDIYLKYILRPGAQIFVDYGWNVKDLYDPKDIVFTKEKDGKTDLGVEEILYGSVADGDKVDGYITEAEGDLDTIIGYVTEYDSKITENGSVECSITLTSKNSALLSSELDEEGKRKKRIEHLLQTGILYFGLWQGTKPDQRDKLEKQMGGLDVRNEEQFNDAIQENATEHLTFKNLELTNTNLMTGVGINSLKQKDSYVSWGFMEDMILNPEFGVGANEQEVTEGKNTEVKIDSSESFTSFTEIIRERQETLGRTEEPSPKFLYPKNWDKTFNTRFGKVPSQGTEGAYPPIIYGSRTVYDTQIGVERIPLREMFVDVDVIKDAMSEKDVVSVLKKICEELNKDSADTFNLKLSNNGPGNIISIVDYNFINHERTVKAEQDAFDSLFEFNVMSPDSIVKGYDLSLSMPDGGISNMIAIQGASAEGKQIFPVNTMVEDAINGECMSILNAQDREEQVDEEGNPHTHELSKFQRLITAYYPNMGAMRGDSIAADAGGFDTKLDFGYDKMDDILDEEIELDTNFNIDYTNFEPKEEDLPGVDDDDEEVEFDEIADAGEVIDFNVERQKYAGIMLTESINDYFMTRIRNDFTVNKKSSTLPVKLTLSIYGIATIQPGDIFRVNYLPKSYVDSVYFQVTKVEQAIDSTGWFTTLQTQFRLRSEGKRQCGLFFEASDVNISPLVIDNLNVRLKGTHDIGWSEDLKISMDLAHLAQYMTHIKPITIKGSLVDKAFTFKARDFRKQMPNREEPNYKGHLARYKDTAQEFRTGIVQIFDFAVTQNMSEFGYADTPDMPGNIPLIYNSTLRSKMWKQASSDMNRYTKKSGKASDGTKYNNPGPMVLPVNWKGKFSSTGNAVMVVVPELVLEEGEDYILYVKGNKWIVLSRKKDKRPYWWSNSSWATFQSDVLELLNLGGSEFASEDEAKRICGSCRSKYMGWNLQDGKACVGYRTITFPGALCTHTRKGSFTAVEQRNICENLIGKNQFCTYVDTVGYVNDCEPSSACP